MPLHLIALVIAAILLLLPPSVGHAAKRVALVIGNAHYSHVPTLENPQNDAEDMADALKRLDFDVVLARDLGRHAMIDTLAAFSERATGAEMALIFYAGHGMSIDKRNYLIPVNAQLRTDRKVSFETVPLDRLIEAMQWTKGIRMVILDACRDNPFSKRMKMTFGKRSLTRGLSRVEPASRTYIGFAAKGGTQAWDGQGRNSPYTAALLEYIEQPGLELNFLFRKVGKRVRQITNQRQEPVTYGSLPADPIYLKPPAKQLAALSPSNQSVTPAETAFWNSVERSGDAAQVRLYLQKFPDGFYASLAKYRLRQLKAEAAPLKKVEVTPQVEEVKPPAEPQLSRRALVRRIQGELNRVGCNAGRPDGAWGQRSRQALKSFAERSKLQLVSLDPLPELLDRLEDTKVRVCPLACSPRHRVEGESCVLKTCARGQTLNKYGNCISSPKAKPKQRDRKKAKPKTNKPKQSKPAKPKRDRKTKQARRAKPAKRGSGRCPAGYKWHKLQRNCVQGDEKY